MRQRDEQAEQGEQFGGGWLETEVGRQVTPVVRVRPSRRRRLVRALATLADRLRRRRPPSERRTAR